MKTTGVESENAYQYRRSTYFIYGFHDSHFDQVPSCMASICFHANCSIYFYSIKKHYLSVGEQLRLLNETEPVEIKGNVVIVPIAGVTRVVEQSVQYAKSLSDQVIAVHVSFDKEKDKKIEADWEKLNSDVRLVILHSSYRSLIHPLDKFLETIEAKANAHQYRVMVLVPQFIPKKDGTPFCIINLLSY